MNGETTMINRRMRGSKERAGPFRREGDAKANKLARLRDAIAAWPDSISAKFLETIFVSVGFTRQGSKSRSPAIHTGSS
jgi:hypothetical protein